MSQLDPDTQSSNDPENNHAPETDGSPSETEYALCFYCQRPVLRREASVCNGMPAGELLCPDCVGVCR